MTTSETKAAELLHAKALLRLMPELGVVGEPEPRERPDFRIALAGSRSAGLEHVRAIDQRIAAGSFFVTLECVLLDRRRFHSQAEARAWASCGETVR